MLLFVGVDSGTISPLRLGAVTGIGYSNYSVQARQSNATSQNAYAGVYAGIEEAGFAARTAVTLAWQQINTKRQIDIPGINTLESANYTAYTPQIFTELGYTVFGNSSYQLQPITQLNYIEVRNSPFFERGNINTALKGTSSSYHIPITAAGLRNKIVLFEDRRNRYQTRSLLAWRYAPCQLNPNAVFSFIGSDNFLISGTPIVRNALLIDMGLDVNSISKNFSFNLSYNGQIATTAQDHSIVGRIFYRF